MGKEVIPGHHEAAMGSWGQLVEWRYVPGRWPEDEEMEEAEDVAMARIEMLDLIVPWAKDWL